MRKCRVLLPFLIFFICINVYADDRALSVQKMQTEQRIALLIGNAAYSSGPLKNPVNDARAMENSLRSFGFSVIKVENGTLRQMDEAISEFGKRLQGGGVGLFYYAGHGIQVNGDNYLIPVNAKIEAEGDVKYEAVNVGKVLSKMESADNRLNIVLLDSCRNNPFARSWRSAETGLAKLDAPTGTFIAYATAPGSVASDGTGRNSVFTEALINAMKIKGLGIEDVLKQVRMHVAYVTARKQIPWTSSSLMGDFYFTVPDDAKDGGDGQYAMTQKIMPLIKAEPKTYTEPRTGMQFVLIEGGCYMMGSEDYDYDEKPLHRVCLDSFYIGRYEVTQGEWEKIMGKNPSDFSQCGSECPVEMVGWQEVQFFIRNLNSAQLSLNSTGNKTKAEADLKAAEAMYDTAVVSYDLAKKNYERSGKLIESSVITRDEFDRAETEYKLAGQSVKTAEENVKLAKEGIEQQKISIRSSGTFRLPTEAEWEYAAKGGENFLYSGSDNLGAVAWYHDNSGGSPQRVGLKQPNGYGLYDMTGNVWEWVEDVYSDSAYSRHQPNNPVYTGEGVKRVFRGGSWYSVPEDARVTKRDSDTPDVGGHNLGLRLVRTIK